MSILNLFEYQREHNAVVLKHMCQEADERRAYWYEHQSKKSKEELKAEVDRFMAYYETTSGFGLPVSIVVAQEILRE